MSDTFYITQSNLIHCLYNSIDLCSFKSIKRSCFACEISHSFIPVTPHWLICAHNQFLFPCLRGLGARAPVVQTIIICAGSKKSHVSQFMSAVVARSDGCFRIWNKLRNHFLCAAVIHLFPRHPDISGLLPLKVTWPAGKQHFPFLDHMVVFKSTF